MAQRQIEVTIESLGAQGDGIAYTADGPVYVPQAAPGDRILVALGKRRGDGFAAVIVERLDDGPNRVTPPCPYFSECGGCTAQHLADPLYGEWKQGLVTTALRRRGLDPAIVAPLRRTKPDGRRRAHLTATHTSRGVQLGYHQRRSDRVLDIEDCLILRPALRRLLPPLRAVLTTALPRNAEAKLLLTETRNGIDLLITTRREFDVDGRLAWAVFAHDHHVARIEWRPDMRAEAEPLAVLESPLVSFSGVDVPIPTGGFLQASAEAEAIMVEILLGALGEAKSVADLFSGSGAFTLPLAGQGCHVHAFDYEAPVIAALQAGAGPAHLGGRITGETRDLFRQPIRTKEFSRYDAVLFDPPRAGAATQVAQLAQATVPLVLAVSCNPASFASDARTLVDGGYHLQWVIPIDQFVYAHHVELVALFTR